MEKEELQVALRGARMAIAVELDSPSDHVALYLTELVQRRDRQVRELLKMIGSVAPHVVRFWLTENQEFTDG